MTLGSGRLGRGGADGWFRSGKGPPCGETVRGEGQSRPAPAPWLSSTLSAQPAVGYMRGGEIPESWPDLVSILSRTRTVSRQVPEFGLVRC